MRFHQLLIENITSLRGTHQIDFDRISEVDDLFAITGPTGSGKSSILSCIMLALYGALPKPDLKQSDLVSLGEKKAKIELLFSVNQKKIRAIWEAKARGSAFSYDRRFLDELGDILPKEILPLSFDQFCKTIILNQGEFAKFLTSSFAERKDILEKLYGEKLLASLSPFLSALIRKKQEELHSITEQEKNLLPYAQEEVEIWKEENTLLAQSIQKEKLAIEAIKVFSSELKDLLRYEQKRSELLLKNAALLEELKVSTDFYNKEQEGLRLSTDDLFSKEQELQKRRPTLLRLIEKEKEIDLLKRSVEEKELSYKSTTSKIKKAQDQEAILLTEISDKKMILSELEASLPSNTSRDLTLQKRLYQEAQKAFFDLKNCLTQIKSEKDYLEKTLLKEKELTKSIEENKLQLKDIPSLSSSTPELLRSKSDELKVGLRKKEEANKRFLELKAQTSSLEKLVQEIEGELQRLHPIKEEAPQKYKDLLQHIKDYLLSEAKHTGSCPICSQEVKKDEKSPRENLNVVIKSSLEIQEELLVLTKTRAKQEERLRQTYDSKSQLEEEKKKLHDIIQDEIDHNIELAKLEKELRHLEDLFRKKLALDQQSLFYTQELQKIHTELQAHQKKLALLEDQKLHFEKSLRELAKEGNIALLDSSFEKLIEDLASLTKGLSEIAQAKEIIEEKNKTLEQSKTHSRLAEEDLKKLSAALDTQKNKLGELNQELAEALPRGQNASSILRTEEGRLIEARQKKDALVAKVQKLEHAKQGLEIQIKTNDEQKQDIDLLMSKLWVKFKEGLIKQQDLGLQTPEKILEPDTVLQIEDWSVLSIFLEQGLTRRLEDLQFSSDEKKQTLETHRAKIDLFEQKKVQQKEIQTELKKKKEDLLRWSNLHDLIGNDEFRNFTLGLIEKELVIFANQELQNLCQGRFALEQTEVKKGNDFSVIDRWKGGELRKVSTLSGGETFLVSLALAMALAEMSRGTASIDSFFIDEGFGTLDQESLTEVLEALGNLKGRGKVVGIISHVKELTERIAVNISIKKNTTGESKVEIVYN